jgi:hypothetical protein
VFTVGRRLGLVAGGSPAGALRIGSSVALRETARQTERAAATVKQTCIHNHSEHSRLLFIVGCLCHLEGLGDRSNVYRPVSPIRWEAASGRLPAQIGYGLLRDACLPKQSESRKRSQQTARNGIPSVTMLPSSVRLIFPLVLYFPLPPTLGSAI